MLESSLVIYKDQIVQLKKGTASQVDFDFEMVHFFIKREEDFDPEQLHFFHLHPFDQIFYSSLDEKCAKALNIAFGFVVNFWILTDNKSNKYKYFRHYRHEENKMSLITAFDIFATKEIQFSRYLAFSFIEKLLHAVAEG